MTNINAVRIDEIHKEIREIKMEQEEAELDIKKLRKGEENIYEVLQGQLNTVRNDMDLWHEDPQVLSLMEEGLTLLLQAERCSLDFIDELQKTKKQIEIESEAKTEELRRELNRLEMI